VAWQALLRMGDDLPYVYRRCRPCVRVLTARPQWRIIAHDLHEQSIGPRILTGTYSRCGEGKFFFTMMAAFAAPVGPPRSARWSSPAHRGSRVQEPRRHSGADGSIVTGTLW